MWPKTLRTPTLSSFLKDNTSIRALLYWSIVWMFGGVSLFFPHHIKSFRVLCCTCGRTQSQILWSAYVKELPNLFCACSQQPNANLKVVIQDKSILWWLQMRLNFAVCPGCLRDITAQHIDARPRVQADHDPLLRWLCFHPPQSVCCEPWVMSTYSDTNLYHIYCTYTVCVHNIPNNKRNNCFTWLLLHWFSMWVITNSLEISALIEIIGIWCPEGNLQATEQHVN